jgi:hypothetical protein
MLHRNDIKLTPRGKSGAAAFPRSFLRGHLVRSPRGLLVLLPKPPVKKRSGNLWSGNLVALAGREHADDFGAADGFRNLSRDGDWLHTRPHLANPV